MKTFPIVQTAFSGYRLLAARPVAALFWFVFQLVVVFGSIALMVAMAGPQMVALQELQASGAPDPATSMALSGPIMLAGFISMALGLVVSAISFGAVSRAVLRPKESGFGYLRFGAEELRLLVVNLVIFILIYIAYMVAAAPAMGALFAVAGMQRAGMALQGMGTLPANAIAIAVAAAVPGVLLLVFLSVKLSLAPAQTIGERQIRIFNSWTLTKGVFWRALAVYLLAAVPVLLVGIVYAGVSVAVHQGGVAGGLQSMMRPSLGTMAAAFSPTQSLSYVLGAVTRTVAMAGLLAPCAAIYAAVAVRSPGALADVFGDENEEDDED